jgi:hypothetical protein
MFKTNRLRKAYEDGLRNGHLDRLIGWRSQYAWLSGSDNDYCGAYSQGYQDGWRTHDQTLYS